MRATFDNFAFYQREVCFCREVAPSISVSVPRCYFAAMDADSGESLALLEDQRPFGELGHCSIRNSQTGFL